MVQLLVLTTVQSSQYRAVRFKTLVLEREARVLFDVTAIEADEVERTKTVSSLLDVLQNQCIRWRFIQDG